MVYQLSVLYPSDDKLHFDMSYYLATHMPLVGKNWKSYGLRKWEITQCDDGPDSNTPKFAVKASLTFDSVKDMQKALASDEAKTVFGDVPNFTNAKPTLLGGEIVGSTVL